MTEKRYTDWQLMKRLLVIARPFWPQISVLLLISLLAAPLALLLPLPIQLAIDSVLGNAPLPDVLARTLPADWQLARESLLWVVLGMMVCVVLLYQARSMADLLLRVYCSASVTVRFRQMLFGHAQRLSLAFHDAKGTADTLYRIQYDALAAEETIVKGVVPMLGALARLLAMLVVVLRLDWLLTLVALAVLPMLVAATQAFRPFLRARWATVKEVESSVLDLVQESLSMIRVVVAFGREEGEQARFTDRATDAVRRQIAVVWTEGILGMLLGLVAAAGMAGVLYLGIRHVQQGTLMLGELALVMFYLAMLYQPMQALAARMGSVQAALASAARAFTLLDEVPDVVELPAARPIRRAQGAVQFRQASFAYGKSPVLREVSFSVDPGTCVGIEGPTGSGKSTLVSLLPRFYDVTEGVVLLDGVDVRDFKLADLRRQFAVVLQDTALISTSFAENIAYGRPGASQDEIEEAARMANAHEFIMQTPQGYAGQVGERGARLSGGERQRIALARAFLRDAPLLILDEPTSAVDTATEEKVLEALERLMKGRTTFIISHRPGTLDQCDLVLRVDGGRVELARSASIRPMSPG